MRLGLSASISARRCSEDAGTFATTPHAYATGGAHHPHADGPAIRRRIQADPGLAFAETGVPLDQPQAFGGRQGITFGAEAQAPPVDSATSAKVSP
ncbi:MAG TPA: hypothetical protein VMS64_30355 [Candidatus Methylomirabilis sp.]|nr:hypothetical protein [Candidatus Methylomirabilis sp.]